MSCGAEHDEQFLVRILKASTRMPAIACNFATPSTQTARTKMIIRRITTEMSRTMGFLSDYDQLVLDVAYRRGVEMALCANSFFRSLRLSVRLYSTSVDATRYFFKATHHYDRLLLVRSNPH